jgi:hypothetical protein
MRFIILDLFFGMAWTFILIHPIGVDEQSGTFMLFVMLRQQGFCDTNYLHEINNLYRNLLGLFPRKPRQGSMWET